MRGAIALMGGIVALGLLDFLDGMISGWKPGDRRHPAEPSDCSGN